MKLTHHLPGVIGGKMRFDTSTYPLLVVTWNPRTELADVNTFIDDFEFLLGEAKKREDHLFLLHDLRQTRELDPSIFQRLGGWLRTVDPDLQNLLAGSVALGDSEVLQMGQRSVSAQAKRNISLPTVQDFPEAAQWVRTLCSQNDLPLPSSLARLAQQELAP